MRVDPGGARRPRPTWRQRIMRMGGQSRPPLRDGTRRTLSPTERDVEDAVPYGVGCRGRRLLQSGTSGTLPLRSTSDRRTCRAGPVCPAARCALTPAGHVGPALHGDSALCRWADRVVRPYGAGRRGRRLLQNGTSRTPSPTDGISYKTVGGDAHIAPRGMRVDPGGARGPRPTWRQRFMQMGGRIVRPYGVGRRGRCPIQRGTRSAALGAESRR